MDEQDLAIGNFRATHEAALLAPSHAEHSLRVAELSKMYEAKFPQQASAEPASASAPVPNAEPAGPESGVDRVAAELAAMVEPAAKLSDYDFSALERPVGVDVQDDPALENWSREWLFAGGVSPAEGKALAAAYSEELGHGFTPDRIEALAGQTETHIRTKYGSDAAAAAGAALRVAEETPGLGDFLTGTGLINHPRIAENLIQAAERRGWFKRTGQ